MIKQFVNIYSSLNLAHDEILSEIYFVLDIEFGLSKQDIILGKKLNEHDFCKAKNIFKKRALTGKPIQYIINKTYFMNDVFYCDENVLIPRDDTQILVEQSINIIKQNNFKTVLDIGTGSGIIAIEIAKHTNTKVIASDISSDALEIAQKNAQNLDVKLDFIQSDLFKNINQKFDLIVSNPPYISHSLRNNLQTEVKNFEPHIALFADSDGLDFYTKITNEARNHLEVQGYLLYEIGYTQAKAVTEIMQTDFQNIFIQKDVSGIERVIGGQLRL